MQENFKRVLFPGVRYSFPEKQDKADPSDKAALRARLAAYGGGDFAEFLFSNLSGLALPTCRILVRELFGDVPPRADSSDTAERIYDFIFSEEKRPAVERDARGAAKDFHARFAGGQPCPSVNAAQDICYTERESAREFSERQRKLESLLAARRKKEEKKLALLCERELSCADMEKNRVFGELITANIYALKKGMEGCELVNYYDEGAAKVKIPLDRTLTPRAERAEILQKIQQAEAHAGSRFGAEAGGGSRSRLHAQHALLPFARRKRPRPFGDRRRAARGGHPAPRKEAGRKAGCRALRTFIFGKFTVYAGRNNVQNDRLLRAAAPDDVWLHTQKYHSSHVLIPHGRAQVARKRTVGGGGDLRVFFGCEGGRQSPCRLLRAPLCQKNLRARGRDSSPTPTSKPFSSSPAATPMRNRHDFQIAPPMR